MEVPGGENYLLWVAVGMTQLWIMKNAVTLERAERRLKHFRTTREQVTALSFRNTVIMISNNWSKVIPAFKVLTPKEDQSYKLYDMGKISTTQYFCLSV